MYLDRTRLHRSLGVDLDNREFVSLTKLGVSELPDFLMKSWMWMETINEYLTDTEKFHLDQGVETERVFAVVVKSIMAQEEGYKVTEARAHAKSHPDYVEQTKKLNTLDSYVNYLKRLYDNLSRYHYMVKSRMDYVQSSEKGYRNIN